jgi:hypothetical protein
MYDMIVGQIHAAGNAGTAANQPFNNTGDAS